MFRVDDLNTLFDQELSDAEWLALAETKMFDPTKQCLTRGPGSWWCSLDEGHVGPHVAHVCWLGFKKEFIELWR